jgi:hypothetical protein
MRCVASSPAAAVQALRTRAADAGDPAAEAELEILEESVFDGTAEALPDDDVEPPAATADPQLGSLIAQAERLAGSSGDPKLALLAGHLAEVLADGFSPVVFCRYIATAHYLGRHLAERFPETTLAVVTGELTPDEREERVAALGESEGARLLVATDCLSEGVNLQEHFDAVVHYDLSWNPTRHEQREGRVDRFGQRSPVVRASLLYGANNPVDGAVLEVILRKGARIREQLGVPVPLPDEGHSLSRALMEAVLLHRRRATPRQAAFDFMSLPAAQQIDSRWRDAAERAKATRTVFAQRRMKPDEVLPEWRRTLDALGGEEDVRRFVDRGFARLGAGLEPVRQGRGGYKAALASLPAEVGERLEAEGLGGTLRVDFTSPAAPRARLVHRSHPLVAILAETLLERTLGRDGDAAGAAPDPSVLGRVGCWASADVAERTVIVLLRLRHQLATQRPGRATTMLVEEATALAWRGAAGAALLEGTGALALLAAPPIAEPPSHVRDRLVGQALELLAARAPDLDAFAARRADALLADHRRVREAAAARGSYGVRSVLPPDVVGLFVLLPEA